MHPFAPRAIFAGGAALRRRPHTHQRPQTDGRDYRTRSKRKVDAAASGRALTSRERMKDMKRHIRTLSLINNELRAIEGDFPASYAAVILFVAQHEAGKAEPPSVSEIADHVGYSRPAVSRITQALSDRRLGRSRADEERPAAGRKALGLVERVADDIDLRMIRVKLSPKGRALLQRMIDHLTN